VSSITAEQLGEELNHAGQNRIYSGGIAQYTGGKGTPNIEFEAKLIIELGFAMNDLPCGGLVCVGTHYDEMSRWLLELCSDGKFPSMSKTLNTKINDYDYYNMIDFFKVKDSSYNKETNYNLKPNYINYIYNNL